MTPLYFTYNTTLSVPTNNLRYLTNIFFLLQPLTNRDKVFDPCGSRHLVHQLDHGHTS